MQAASLMNQTKRGSELHQGFTSTKIGTKVQTLADSDKAETFMGSLLGF